MKVINWKQLFVGNLSGKSHPAWICETLPTWQNKDTSIKTKKINIKTTSMSENVLETWLSGKLFGIDFIFINLDTYYKSIIALLVQKSEDFKINYPNTLKAIDKHIEEEANKPENIDLEDFRNTYYDYLVGGQDEIFNDLTVKYPKYFRSFFLTQVYSYTESELKNICDYIHSKGKTNVSFSSFYNSLKKDNKRIGFVEGYLNYLSKYAGLNMSQIKAEIDDLKSAGIIRNIIVHNSGIVKETHGEWTLIETIAMYSKQIELYKKSSKKEFEIIIPNDLLISKVIESSKNLFKKLLEDGLITIN